MTTRRLLETLCSQHSEIENNRKCWYPTLDWDCIRGRQDPWRRWLGRKRTFKSAYWAITASSLTSAHIREAAGSYANGPWDFIWITIPPCAWVFFPWTSNMLHVPTSPQSPIVGNTRESSTKFPTKNQKLSYDFTKRRYLQESQHLLDSPFYYICWFAPLCSRLYDKGAGLGWCFLLHCIGQTPWTYSLAERLH